MCLYVRFVKDSIVDKCLSIKLLFTRVPIANKFLICMTEVQRHQYQTIIHARNFHYEQFTRWSSYFYVVIGALFVGYYVITNGNSTNTQKTNVLSWVILSVGYLTSVANFLSVKGYIYWWQHWNILLTRFEEKVCKEEEKVYSVFANVHNLNHPVCPLNGSNISTSKVALFVAGVIMLGWSILIGYGISKCISVCCGCSACCLWGLMALFAVILYGIGAVIMPILPIFHSDMSNNTDLRLNKTSI